MKNPSCFWHHLIFNPHPPFSRPAAGSGFFDSKTSKLLRCWTRYYAGARSQYLARARGAHRAGRAGRGGQGGGGRLLLAAVQGIRAGDREQRRGAVCCSSGGLHPHRGRAEVRPGRSDPQRGGMIQHSEGAAASWAGRCWRSRKKKKTGRAGRVACSACFAVCRCSLFSAAAGSSSVGDAGGDLLHSSTFHGMPPGCFSRGSGAVLFAVPEGGYTLHLTGLRSRCRALT